MFSVDAITLLHAKRCLTESTSLFTTFVKMPESHYGTFLIKIRWRCIFWHSNWPTSADVIADVFFWWNLPSNRQPKEKGVMQEISSQVTLYFNKNTTLPSNTDLAFPCAETYSSPPVSYPIRRGTYSPIAFVALRQECNWACVFVCWSACVCVRVF